MNNVDNMNLLAEYLEFNDLADIANIHLAIDWNRLDLLAIAEQVQNDKGEIADEAELADRFDELVEDFGMDKEDKIAINEMFSNWCDALVSVGELTPIQYSHYSYAGVYK